MLMKTTGNYQKLILPSTKRTRNRETSVHQATSSLQGTGLLLDLPILAAKKITFFVAPKREGQGKGEKDRSQVPFKYIFNTSNTVNVHTDLA